MKKEELFKSKVFKILLPLIGLIIVAALWRNGYQFGQWLFNALN